MSGMVMPLEVSFLYRIVLAILGFCFSVWSWVLFFQSLWRIVLVFWWGLHWIYRILVRLPILLCWSYLSKSLGDLSFFWYLLQFFSKTYSSFWTVSLLWLVLPQYILCYLWLLWMVMLLWLFFLFLSHLHIGGLLIVFEFILCPTTLL